MPELNPNGWAVLVLFSLGATLAAWPTLAGWVEIARALIREVRRGRKAEAKLRRYDPPAPCLVCRKAEHGRWYLLNYPRERSPR